jgi:hypothetical protein
LHALAIGSNTAVSRQGNASFPFGATDNAMIGFAAFENGFGLADGTTSVSFDSLFPVSGTIDLEGGNLYLMQQMILTNTTRFSTMGSIYGNGKKLKLCPSITALRATSTDLQVTLTSYNMAAAVSGVDFSQSFSYVVAVSANNATGAEIRMLSFDGAGLTSTVPVTDAGRDAICCRWQPGKTNFAVGISSGVGSQLFSYAYNRSNGVLTQASSLNLPSGQSIDSVAFSPGGNYLAVGRSIASGGNKTEIFMYSVSTSGVLSVVLNQSLPTDHSVSINAISWSPGGNYFAMGTAALAGSQDLFIYQFDGSTLTLTAAATTGFTSRGVDWSPSGTFIAVAFNGSTTNDLAIYTHTPSNGNLTLQTSANINQTTDVISVAWTGDGNRLLVGTSYAGGTGAMRQYSFNKTATTLSLVNSLSFNASVNSVRSLGANDQYVMGVGNYVYITGGSYTDGFTLTVDRLTLELTNDIILGTPMGFTNTCTILGNNNTISFDTTGTMIILPYANLLLKDVTLKNLSGTQLRCFDNTASLSFDNVKFIFDGDYFFNAGSFHVLTNFSLSGTNKFIYQSTGQSTIRTNATFLCDYGSTFSYAPTSNQRSGISLLDNTSTLILNNATLYSTSTGLRLTTGNLIIDGKITFQSDAKSIPEGIAFGDNTNAANDLKVVYMPGAKLSVASGYLLNENLS